MDRGSIVLVSAKGEYGKSRPAVVVQDSRMEDIVGSITVCFLTSDLSKEHRILRRGAYRGEWFARAFAGSGREIDDLSRTRFAVQSVSFPQRKWLPSTLVFSSIWGLWPS